MGVELVRKYGNIAIRSCYISALRHPFLVVMVFHLIWMYRTFPFLFSLMVYASPVIVSTAVLLGTLLFFGHQNVPEIPKDGKRHHLLDIHNRKFVVMEDTEIDGSSGCEETHEKKTFVVNNNNTKIINDDHSSLHRGSSVDDDSESKARKQAKQIIAGEEERVVLVDRCSQHHLSEAKNIDKLKGDSIDPSNSGPGLLWKYGEKHRAEDNKGWETGSEVAESSSPTSADIFPIPMLDELLEPQHTHRSNINTDAASDHSLDETDDDDEEDIQVKDDQEANVEKEITWAEDDQKNLMNLGTSEIERNQHLETLIARQRALKNMRILAEKNMVNLSPDIPFNISTTTRKNHPFDDSNAHILGSASSVMDPFTRNNNPFGEKPDTQSDSVNHPFYESFDVGPSTLVASRQGFNLGPYFERQQMHKQTGEVSDSKVSESTSSSSDDDLEQKNHDDSCREAGVKQHFDTCETSEHVSQINRSSEDDDDIVKLYDQDGRLDEEVKIMSAVDEEAGNQEKTSSNWSSSPLSDVTDHIYDEKEGETNYFGGPKNSSEKPDMQVDVSKRPPTPTRYVEEDHLTHEEVVPNNKEQQLASFHHNGISEEKIISLTDRSDKSTRYAEDQNPKNNNKEQQSTVKPYSPHKGNYEDKITSQSEELDRSVDKPTRYVEDHNTEHKGTSEEKIEELSLKDRSMDKPTRYVEHQNGVVPDHNTEHKGTSEEKIEELSLTTDRSMDKPTRYVEDQNVVVPDHNKKQESAAKTSSHHKGTSEELSLTTDRSTDKTTRYEVEDRNDNDTFEEKKDDLSLMERSTTRYVEDQNVVVPDHNEKQESAAKTSSHHKGTSEELSLTTDRSTDKTTRYEVEDRNDNDTFEEKKDDLSLMERSTTRYVEDQNVVVPDHNEKQESAAKTSSHHKGTSEELSLTTDRSTYKTTRYEVEDRNDNDTFEEKKDDLSLMERSTTRYVEDQNVVVPDHNEKQESAAKTSSHHKGTSEELSLTTDRSTDKTTRYEVEDRNDNDSFEEKKDELSLMERSTTRYVEDQNIDNKEQQSAVSSHHNDTFGEKIISQPQELSIIDRSMDKPTRYVEDQHVVVPDHNKEQDKGIFEEKIISRPEEKPMTNDSQELQMEEQGKQVSPKNNSTSTTTAVKFSSMGTKSPPSPEYESNMTKIHKGDKIEDISDIGDSSVYDSGFDSDTDRSENANTEFASASESEMSRTNEPRFPQRLSQVPQDLASWLTGWRV